MSRQRLRWDILDAFAAAADQAGIRAHRRFQLRRQRRRRYFDVNQRSGLRVSAAKAFLKPVRSRANLTVWTRTLAERLQFATTRRATALHRA